MSLGDKVAMREDFEISKGLWVFKVDEEEGFRGYLGVWMTLQKGLRG